MAATATVVRRSEVRTKQRRALPWLGGIGLFLTFFGFSGISDAPAPTQSAELMVEHFLEVGDGVLYAAPAGYVGAALLAAFFVGLARKLHERGQASAAWAVGGGGALVAGYFVLAHLVFTTIGYEIAETSAVATKTLFVGTILAVPIMGLGLALVLGGSAYAVRKTGMLPRWWVALSVVGAAVAAIAPFSYAYNDAFSPDVQQQIVTAVMYLWGIPTIAALRRLR